MSNNSVLCTINNQLPIDCNITSIYQNNTVSIYIDSNKKILYVDIIDGEYNKENFFSAIEYYKNFWILIEKSNEKYYQIFIFNKVKFYPLEFYDNVFKTLKSLEDNFKKTLHSSCLVNDSNAMDIFRPLLNMYKAVRPFNFVKTLEDGYDFISKNKLVNTSVQMLS